MDKPSVSNHSLGRKCADFLPKNLCSFGGSRCFGNCDRPFREMRLGPWKRCAQIPSMLHWEILKVDARHFGNKNEETLKNPSFGESHLVFLGKRFWHRCHGCWVENTSSYFRRSGRRIRCEDSSKAAYLVTCPPNRRLLGWYFFFKERRESFS